LSGPAGYALPLNGSAADLVAALAGSFSAAYTGSVSVSDTASVVQANAIDAATDGVVTATLAAGTLASFASLAGTGNAYTITVIDAVDQTLSASNLADLGGKTTGAVTVTNPVTISGQAADVLAAFVTPETSVSFNTGSTINVTNYTNQDLSSIGSEYSLNVIASTANSSVLSGAITSGALSQADQITLAAPSGNQVASLKNLSIDTLDDLDSFLIDADSNDSVLSVRLSDTLSNFSGLEVRLDGGNGTNALGDPAWARDTVVIESNLFGATFGAPDELGSGYDSTTTWAQLGLGGVNVYNFVSNKDSFGVVDSTGALVFNSWKLGMPAGSNFSTDGRVYLDVSGFVDINSVSEIRTYIGDSMSKAGSNTDSGFALLGIDADDNVDIAIFHAKWTGLSGLNPEADSSNLLVSRIAVLQNVNLDATVGLTSALQAPNFIASSLPSGLA